MPGEPVASVSAPRVRLFGGPRVDGLTASELGSRKARTLLAALALARGDPLGVDRLVEVVWGDEPPARPADQLGVLVSRLRRVLGAGSIPRLGDGYALRAGWLDLAELEERAADAAARLRSRAPGAALASARAALALAGGELLGDERGEWAELERRRVERLLADLALVAGEAALAVGEPLAAAGTAERALARDPYDEAALRLLMRAQVAAGRPGSALAAYARVSAALADDLGTSPTEETEALHTRILRGQERPAVPRRPGAALVGREAELGVLERLLGEVEAGGTRVALLEGEPGIGKSSLLAAFLAGARGQAAVLAGSCDPLGRDMPLQPLLDGLDALLRGMSRPAAAEILGADAGLVGPLLGSLPVDTAAGPVGVPTDAAEAQLRLFAALLRVVGRASEQHGRAVVAVDDLHHAGPSTLAWLRFTARRGDRLLLVLASRSPVADPPEGAVRLPLGPLDLAAAERLVGAGRAAELLERSGGNPLLLLALEGGEAGAALPGTVREAVGSLLATLGPAVETLRAAAVLGPPVDLDLLAEVLGRPATAVLDDLEAGVRSRVVVEREAGLAFAHELVREALAADTGAARRRLLHRRAAEVLAARERRDPLVVVWHAREGGAAALAAAELVRAARLAALRSDLTAAEQLAQEALRLDPTPEAHLALGDVRMRRGAFAEAAEAAGAAIQAGAGATGYELAGWIAYYRRDYHRALGFAEAGARCAGDTRARSLCAALVGRIHHSLGDLAAADATLSDALSAAPAGADGVERMWLASLRVHQGRPREALELTEPALLAPGSIGHPFVLGHGYMAHWYALGMLGRPDEAMRALEAYRASPVITGLTRARFVGVAMNMAAWLLRGMGELAAAEDSNLAAVAQTDFPGISEHQAHGALDLVEHALLIGDPAEAERRLARVELQPVDRGTMVWRQRERRELLRAQLAFGAGEWDRVREIAAAVERSAAARGSRRHELVARLLDRCGRARAGEPAHPAEVEATLDALARVAGLEAWRWTGLAAASLGVDAWWDRAAVQAAGLARRSGVRGDRLATFAERWLARARAGGP
jgi:DNA-binding SARP family transcriptional activator/tetratricopeptide (TPR) repeat protein